VSIAVGVGSINQGTAFIKGVSDDVNEIFRIYDPKKG